MDGGERSAVPLVYNVYHTCAIGQLRAMVQAPGVRQWGPCSGVGEAGRPGDQRRSVMTAAAVVVGGLALWRGHPARRCPALCVHRAAADPSSKWSFIVIASVRPCLLRTRETGWWGGGGGAEPTLPSRGPNEGLQWMTHILGNCICRLA